MRPKQWDRGFNAGYLCALSTLVRNHGLGVEIEEALAALGPVNWRTVEPYDLEALEPARRELERKRKMREAQP